MKISSNHLQAFFQLAQDRNFTKAAGHLGILLRYCEKVARLEEEVLPAHLIKNEKNIKILFPKTKLRVPVYLLFYESPYRTKIEIRVIEAITNFFKGLL